MQQSLVVWWLFLPAAAQCLGERFLLSFENGTILTLDAWSGKEVGRFWSGGALQKTESNLLVGAEAHQIELLAARDLPDTRCVVGDEGLHCELLYGERRKTIIAVDVATGSVAWTTEGGLEKLCDRPVLLQRDEYVARLMDAEDGFERWHASYAEIKAFGPLEDSLIPDSSSLFPLLEWSSDDLRLSALSEKETQLWDMDFAVTPVNIFAATGQGGWANVRVRESSRRYRLPQPDGRPLLAAPPMPLIKESSTLSWFYYLCIPFVMLLAGIAALRPNRKPPPVPLVLSTDRYASDFEELELLGDGGFATVHRSLNRLDAREYAVKKIKGADLTQVVSEVKLLAGLDHVNVVRYYQAWVEEYDEEEDASVASSSSSGSSRNDDEPTLILYIQMQLCANRTFRHRLDRRDAEPLPPSVLLRIVSQAADGLSYVHARGLVHRDVKPANIFLTLEDVVKLGDFGLSRRTSTAESDLLQLSSRRSHDDRDRYTSGLGTALYAAPEQLSSASYDFKVDVYSLGVVVLEALSPLFSTHFERYEKLKALVDRRDRLSPQQPDLRDLADLAHLMVAKRPRIRPPSARVAAAARVALDKLTVKTLASTHDVLLRDPDGSVRHYDAQGNPRVNSYR